MRAQLTEREIEILVLGARGFTQAESAERLSIARNTVKKHRQRIILKLGATNFSNAIWVARDVIEQHLRG